MQRSYQHGKQKRGKLNLTPANVRTPTPPFIRKLKAIMKMERYR